MNFHYHPILGLQYSYGFEIFEINIDAIPVQEFNAEEWMRVFSKIGIMIVDHTPAITNIFNRITSNVLMQ